MCTAASPSRALQYFPLSTNLSPIYLICCFAFSICFPEESCGMAGDREGVCLVQGFTVELNKWMTPQYLKQCLAHIWPPLLFDQRHIPVCPGQQAWERGHFWLGGGACPPFSIQPCVGRGGAGRHYLVSLASCCSSAARPQPPWDSGPLAVAPAAATAAARTAFQHQWVWEQIRSGAGQCSCFKDCWPRKCPQGSHSAL